MPTLSPGSRWEGCLWSRLGEGRATPESHWGYKMASSQRPHDSPQGDGYFHKVKKGAYVCMLHIPPHTLFTFIFLSQ